MSTRGCVAVGVPLKWEGVYNHCDSYPTGLGVDMWDILRHIRPKDFAEKLLQQGSWPAFLAAELQNGHDTHLDCEHITNETPDPLFIEWVYIVDPERNMLHILRHESVGGLDFSRRRPARPAMLPGRIVDYGHCAYKHVLVASLKLDGPEPDWAKLEMDGREAEAGED